MSWYLLPFFLVKQVIAFSLQLRRCLLLLLLLYLENDMQPFLNLNRLPSLSPKKSSSFFSLSKMDAASEDCSDTSLTQNDDVRVYFGQYRWWKEAGESISVIESDVKGGVLYTASPSSSYAGPMKIINNIFSSDIVFNLKREGDSLQDNQNGDVGISGWDYALAPGEMWSQALKWHNNSKAAMKDGRSFSASSEDDMGDVYPLQLRLSIPQESNSLGVKISKKLRIWDFSGQTTQYFLDDKEKSPKDSQWQAEQDILLEFQVYGLSDLNKKDVKKDEITGQHPNEASLMMNGSSGKFNSNFVRSSLPAFCGNSCETGSLGLTGL